MNINSVPATAVPWKVTKIEPGSRRGHNCRDKQQRHAARKIGPVIEYMLQHLNKPLRTSALSATAGVSVSHFFSLFKTATGCAPIDFFIRLRVQRACSLLWNKNLRIKEIATLLGYDDPYYFSRSFKAVIGIAPIHYRKLALRSLPEKSELAHAGGKQADKHDRFSQFVSSETFTHGDANGGGFHQRNGHFSADFVKALPGNLLFGP